MNFNNILKTLLFLTMSSLIACGETEETNYLSQAEKYTKLRQWERAKEALAKIEESDSLYPKAVKTNHILDSLIYDSALNRYYQMGEPTMAIALLKNIEEGSDFYEKRVELENISKNNLEQQAPITTSSNNGSQTSNRRGFTFILTHMLGQKMPQNASFNVGEFDTWIMDFHNGENLTYQIISMNENNPMCGISARDNFGDLVDICITKTAGDGVSVEMKYGTKRINYKGYLQR